MKKSFCVEDIAVGILLVFGFLGIFYIFSKFYISSKEIGTVSDKRKVEQGECDSQFTSFEWHGHKYLRYSDYDTHTYTLLHDPDCPCHTNKTEVTQ